MLRLSRLSLISVADHPRTQHCLLKRASADIETSIKVWPRGVYSARTRATRAFRRVAAAYSVAYMAVALGPDTSLHEAKEMMSLSLMRGCDGGLPPIILRIVWLTGSNRIELHRHAPFVSVTRPIKWARPPRNIIADGSRDRFFTLFCL